MIADKDKGKDIFDRCKSLRAFVDDHLPAYKEMLLFVNDNVDNFHYLSNEDQQKAEKLRALATDEWPIPNMKVYRQLKTQLAKALELVKQEKRKEIEHRYRLVFDDLRHVCAEADVEYQINEQNVLSQKTVSDKLYVLAGNLKSTDDYRAEQVKEIMSRRQGGGDAPGKKKRRIRMVSLHTGSTTPLNTEADVDCYLAKLKAELMKIVNSREENDDIMVK